jgi:hypothetical protein
MESRSQGQATLKPAVVPMLHYDRIPRETLAVGRPHARTNYPEAYANHCGKVAPTDLFTATVPYRCCLMADAQSLQVWPELVSGI